jgi:hypothetical protein
MSVNLAQLHRELAAAGIDVPALGVTDGIVHSYDDQGQQALLPNAALVIVAAHTPETTAHERDLALLRASADPTIQALLRVLGLAEGDA